jgi:hypothetical protein
MASLRIAILPSASLGVLLCVVHMGAGALGALLPVPLWSKAVLLTAVAWSLAWSLQTHALVRARDAIVGIGLERDGGVIAHTREGVSLACELMPSSFVSHRLTVLNVRPRGTRRERHVVLCCGNVNEADLRRLRVRLRWAVPKSMHLEA